ncbi:hypothetical protein DFH06DRAFT_1348007 [Mycena polygramma]|nr:hypothetical protein DFH06DRAFT_1348007 [Mycena polygramma]
MSRASAAGAPTPIRAIITPLRSSAAPLVPPVAHLSEPLAKAVLRASHCQLVEFSLTRTSAPSPPSALVTLAVHAALDPALPVFIKSRKHPYTPHPVFMLLALGQCILSSLYVLRTLLRDVSFPPLLFPPFSPRALSSVALLFYPSRLPHCHLLPCLRSLLSPRNSPSFFRLPPLKTARGALCASPIPQFPGWLRWAGIKNRFITYDNANARLCGLLLLALEVDFLENRV